MLAKSGFPETQASLVARLHDAADNDAWAQFIDLYRPVIYRLARQRGLQDADAQDLAQWVLTALSRAIGNWRPDDTRAKFRTWVARIANNAINNVIQRGRFDRARGGSSVWELLAAQSDDDDRSQSEFDHEARREIFRQAAVQVRREASPDQWEAFILSTTGGLSVEATAERLGKTVGAVYACRSRVMRHLKEAVRAIESN